VAGHVDGSAAALSDSGHHPGAGPDRSRQAWQITAYELGQRLGLDWPSGSWSSAQYQIVWRVRLPRVLLAALTGAGLALVGVAMQAMVRNPLADPYLLGVSSGASVGAVSVLAFGALAFAGELALLLGAFMVRCWPVRPCTSWPMPMDDCRHRGSFWAAWPLPTAWAASPV
jgi:ABC-type Fe3+-siderophore transport system permease subunit